MSARLGAAWPPMPGSRQCIVLIRGAAQQGTLDGPRRLGVLDTRDSGLYVATNPLCARNASDGDHLSQNAKMVLYHIGCPSDF